MVTSLPNFSRINLAGFFFFMTVFISSGVPIFLTTLGVPALGLVFVWTIKSCRHF